MAYFPYGISYEVIQRREEFFGSTFDEMIGRIIELEQDLETSQEESKELQEKINELEAGQ